MFSLATERSYVVTRTDLLNVLDATGFDVVAKQPAGVSCRLSRRNERTSSAMPDLEHRRRSRSAPAVHHRWADVPDALWNHLHARHPFETSAWLTAVDLPGYKVLTTESTEGLSGVGLVGPEPTGTLPPLHTALDILCGDRTLAVLRRLGMPAERPPTSAAASLTTVLSPFAYRTCLPGTSGKESALATLRDTLDLSRSRGATGVFIPYLREDEGAVLDAVAELDGTVGVIGAGCRVSVEHTDPGSAFAEARKSARRAYRRYQQRVDGGTVGAQVLDPGEPLAAERRADAVELMALAAQRHGVRRPPLELYRAVLGTWPTTRTFQWSQEEGGRLAGCALGFVDDGRLVAKLGGHRDRDRGHLDVNLTGSIVLGHRLGVNEVDLGASTHEHKLERGGQVYWIYGALIGPTGAERHRLDTWTATYEQRFVAHLTRSASVHGQQVPSAGHSTCANPESRG